LILAIELRADGKRLLWLTRRPPGTKAQGIGMIFKSKFSIFLVLADFWRKMNPKK
jgi:hypothetical protein